jgi:hypothetical protein
MMGDKQALKALQLKAQQWNRDVKAANWNGRISPRDDSQKALSDRVAALLQEFFVLSNDPL